MIDDARRWNPIRVELVRPVVNFITTGIHPFAHGAKTKTPRSQRGFFFDEIEKIT